MDFQITNIVPEENMIRVFYRFSNDEENSNLFDSKATMVDLLNWGNKRIKFFIEQAEEVKRRAEELQEQIDEGLGDL